MGLVMVGAELELVAFALRDDQPLGTIAVATLAQTLANDHSRNARDRNQSPDTATVVTDIRVVSLVSSMSLDSQPRNGQNHGPSSILHANA